MVSKGFTFVITLIFLTLSFRGAYSALASRRTSFYIVNYSDNHNSSNFEDESSETNSQSIHDGLRTGNTTELLESSVSPQVLQPNATSSIMCYYNIPRMSDRPYPVFPEALDASLCSHLVVRGAKVVNLTLEPNDILDVQFYNRIIRLKQINPKLKVLLSLESVNDDTGKGFVQMISTNDTRQRFIRNTVNTVNQHDFDGLEISWKYPCFDGPIEQKQLFADFLQEFRDCISINGSSMLLTAAVSANKEIIDIAYDIAALARSLDFISLMSYDYHTFSWMTPITGPNSPLFHMKNEIAMLSTLNVEWSANYWNQNGMPASKIIVGIPSYGRSYTLTNEENHSYYDLAKGLGSTGYKGYVTFPELCEFLSTPNVTSVYNNVTAELYAYKGAEWISFENEQSASTKAAWIHRSGFGGVAVKDLNSDDAYKQCTKPSGSTTTTANFPIARAIYDILYSSSF
ncbi:Acidic mammalian chitinase [Orchesella cincta]|uniref:Acidic mammalian chitinase n=1 Tax=Orchesella cincta TaxID=48709 RepID=A0A1D2NGJ6_ORCCI|nr:Acidic mammalian chitinase [Orchesella cincta]